MSSNWVPPGSSGQGPPAGQNTDPVSIPGVEPGARNQGGGGFRSNTREMRESLSVVGKLTSAMSSFYRQVGGDGKRKFTEFQNVVKALNADLEETRKNLEAVAHESAKVGGGQQGGGGLFVPTATGGSYTQRQLPRAVPTVDQTVTRAGGGAEVAGPGAGGGGGGQAPPESPGGISRGMQIAGGVALGGLWAGANWFNRMAGPAAAMDLQTRRMAMTGPTMEQSRAQFSSGFGRGDFRSYEELFGTQESLEQRGIGLGGQSFERLMQDAGGMRHFLPAYTPEQIAGAGATLRHGEAGRNLRMKGIIDWDMPTEEVFRQILKAATRDKQMPSADLLMNADPGSAYYEVLMVLTGGDTELVRMVLEWGRAEVASEKMTGTHIDTSRPREHATAMGLGDVSVEGRERAREGAAADRLLSRQETLADELQRMHRNAERLTGWMQNLEDEFRPLVDVTQNLSRRMSEFGNVLGNATGGLGNQLTSLGGMWMAGRMGAGKSIIPTKAGVAAVAAKASRGAKAAGGWIGRGARGGAGAAAGLGQAAATAGSSLWSKAGRLLGGAGALFFAGQGQMLAGHDYDQDVKFYGQEFADRFWAAMEARGIPPGSGAMDSLVWDEDHQARERLFREMGEDVVEPSGGPPISGVSPLLAADLEKERDEPPMTMSNAGFGSVHGADHTGSGYSKRGFGGVKPHVAQAGHYILRKFGNMPGGIGGVGRRSNPNSDHPRGLALDLMTMKDTALGDRIVNFLTRNAKHFAIKYIIWKQRINSGSGWRKMEDRGSITANHFDHPHVSFHESPSAGGTGGFDDSGGPEEEAQDQGGFAGAVPASPEASTAGSSPSVEEADFLAGIFGQGGGGGSGVGAPGSQGEQMQEEGAGGPPPAVSSGEKLSDEKLMQVIRSVGFSGTAAITAFAIAKAESGGNAGAHNNNPRTGDNSYGLFQINMLGSMGPARRKQYGLRSNTDLFNPVTNARIAYDMSSRGTRWGHWSVHPESKSRGASGSGYEQHLATARQLSGGAVEPRGGLADPVGSLSEGMPSGGSSFSGASIGGVSPRPATAMRQSTVYVNVKLEGATRREAEDLVKMVKDIMEKEERRELVGDR